jgi:glycosyltransferase involved in cell wall biosynthesis
MEVIYFFRKPRIKANFSIEKVFNLVGKNLPDIIFYKMVTVSLLSNGFINRLLIGLQVFLNRGQVNHVTGDIHFAALFLPRKRTVLTIHDIGFLNAYSGFKNKLLRKFWIDLPCKWCAAVTTVSEATKHEILHLLPSLAHKIVVIPNPMPEHFHYSPRPFRKETPSILQIGTKFNKNVIRLIEALEGIPCRLEIIGELTDELIVELEKHHIKYVSSVNIDEQTLINKYKESDIVAFVSTHEGFGLPIIEANAIGRVVLTSNISSMPEIGGDAAYYVNPYDVASIRAGIQDLIENEEKRKQLLLNGRENIKRFEPNCIAEKYAVLYKQLLSDL